MRAFGKTFLILLLFLSLIIPMTSCTQDDSPLDPDRPTHITVWHYYNSTQLIAFDNMVNTFNQTVGKETGIFVESVSQGTVNELASKVLDTAKGIAGAGELPDIFGAYPDTAYDVLAMGKVVDLDDYMTEEEISAYHESFWEEGVIDGVSAIFPIAKSTEVLFIDENAWNEFAQGTGETRSAGQCMATWGGVAQVAEAYYEYTDALTPAVDHDGKALIGIDSMANFLLVLQRQMGVDFMHNQDGRGVITYDTAVLQRIWDIYYRSMVQGYFASVNRYRSDDMKTGILIGFLGSSTGTSYFPEIITHEDGTQREGKLIALPMPVMEGGDPCVVQQGGGMVVTKTDGQREYASVVFLKWLTEAERNLSFAIESSYLPVQADALTGSSMDAALSAMEASGDTTQGNTAKVFRIALNEIDNYAMYYSPTFPGRLDIRYALDDLQPRAAQARLDVLEAAGNGENYQVLIEAYAGRAAFEEWVDELKDTVDAILEQY